MLRLYRSCPSQIVFYISFEHVVCNDIIRGFVLGVQVEPVLIICKIVEFCHLRKKPPVDYWLEPFSIHIKFQFNWLDHIRRYYVFTALLQCPLVNLTSVVIIVSQERMDGRQIYLGHSWVVDGSSGNTRSFPFGGRSLTERCFTHDARHQRQVSTENFQHSWTGWVKAKVWSGWSLWSFRGIVPGGMITVVELLLL